MQVEAHDVASVRHGDRPALVAQEGILAAQVAAVRRQPQAPAVDDAVERAVAVVAHVEPLGAGIVGPIDQHVAGAILECAVGGDLGRIDVVHHRRRMRGREAHEVMPVARRAGIGAAVHDQPLMRGAHLEAQGAGMGDPVHAATRRAAGVRDHQRRSGGQPLKAARQRHRRCDLARPGARQHEVDQAAVAFPRAVEQRQASVAMAEEPQHRRHAVDRGDQFGGRPALGRRQGGPYVDQVAQDGELQVRGAFGNNAVVQHIALHELREPRQRLLEALFEVLAVPDEGEVGEDQRLVHRDRFVADHAAARDAAQMHALAAERKDETGREPGIGRRGHPFVVPDPGDHARRQHVALPRHRRPAPFAVGPVVDQLRGQQRPVWIAIVAQVAQPGEAVQPIEPDRRGTGTLPRRIVRIGQDRAAAAADRELARLEKSLPSHRIARPGIGSDGEETAGRAVTQGQGIERRAEKPAAEGAAFSLRRGGRAGRDRADRAGAGDQRFPVPSCVSDQGHLFVLWPGGLEQPGGGGVWGILAQPEPSGDGPVGLERRALHPKFIPREGPHGIPCHSLHGRGVI